MTVRLLAAVAALILAMPAAAQQTDAQSSVPATPPTDVRLYAAGSLRTAMTSIAQAFKESGGPTVVLTFGASGLLRERIEKGERPEVFASADLGNAEKLAQAGRMTPPIMFARNRLCALVAPGIDASTETLLDRMLDPKVKVGTSTPMADPSGDYAWQLFDKADKLRPGAYATLDAKALKLTGGPNSPSPPAGRSIYGVMIAERKADIFLTYCTNAAEAVREVSGARVVAIPETLAVGADYALSVAVDAPPWARHFAAFVTAPEAQQILAEVGFAPVKSR